MTVPEGDEMSELERLDEAFRTLDQHGVYTGVKDSLGVVFDAARAYRNLLAGGQMEPDYEAAAVAVQQVNERIAQARSGGQRFSLTEIDDMKMRAAADAAIGGRLLVDPPKEEE